MSTDEHIETISEDYDADIAFYKGLRVNLEHRKKEFPQLKLQMATYRVPTQEVGVSTECVEILVKTQHWQWIGLHPGSFRYLAEIGADPLNLLESYRVTEHPSFFQNVLSPAQWARYRNQSESMPNFKTVNEPVTQGETGASIQLANAFDLSLLEKEDRARIANKRSFDKKYVAEIMQEQINRETAKGKGLLLDAQGKILKKD